MCYAQVVFRDNIYVCVFNTKALLIINMYYTVYSPKQYKIIPFNTTN